MKPYYCLFFLLCMFSAKSQIIEEIVTDGNGMAIESSDENFGMKNPADLIDYFYQNQNDVDKLSRMMSVRFFQKTPFFKFKEVIKQKNELFGKIKSKKVVETKNSEDKLAYYFELKVIYEKGESNEKLVLIKEHFKDNFQIYQYDIMKN